MNKLLQHMVSAGDVSDKFLTGLPKGVSVSDVRNIRLQKFQKGTTNQQPKKEEPSWYDSLVDYVSSFFEDEPEVVTTAYQAPAKTKIRTAVPIELLKRQAWKESNFNPDAYNKGSQATGMTQIKPIALKDYNQRHGTKYYMSDLKDPKVAIEVQNGIMEQLYSRPWVNRKGQPQEVTDAKAVIAYNYGPSATVKKLNELKAQGIDIYSNNDWVQYFPTEPRDYTQKIVMRKYPKFNREYDSASRVNPIMEYYEDYENEFAHGGPIVDPRGQWAHPGKHTIVPTPNGRITMQGVPYPVYGQDETGYGQMMYPGAEYKFPGQIVYERPIMQKGGNKPEPRSFGMFSINPRNWGLNDYSEYPSFNHAFRAARNAKEKEFYFKGERYNTNLIPKEESDAYWDSKKFLKEFYEQNTKDNQLSDLERYDYERQYLLDNLGFSSLGSIDVNNEEDIEKFNKYIKLYDQLQADPKLIDQYGNKKLVEKKIKNLNEPSYFSITSQKPRKMSEDGYWDSKNNRLFMTTNSAEKDPGKLNTTYIHELAHKSNKGEYDYNVPEINLELLNSSPYRRGIDQKFYDYVSNPSEIEARKMSTLYYLNKQGLPYKPGKITEDNLSRLYTDYAMDKLPYDVGQLLQLYGQQKEDLLKYLNGQKFKSGGQHGGLDRWFAEKWVDVKTGKPCGRQEGEDRSYPACRPSRRVSSQTPKTSSEMSPAEKAKFKRVKTSSQRISYNHKRNL